MLAGAEHRSATETLHRLIQTPVGEPGRVLYVIISHPKQHLPCPWSSMSLKICMQPFWGSSEVQTPGSICSCPSLIGICECSPWSLV